MKLGAALALALTGACGCDRCAAVHNLLGVEVQGSSLRALRRAAARDDMEVESIELTVCFHPNDQAVAKVHYEEVLAGRQVVSRERIFGNSAWPGRFDTRLGVDAYRRSLGAPSQDWQPETEDVVETVRHRFLLDGTTVEMMLGEGVAYEQASAILQSLAELDPSTRYAKLFLPTEVTSIERTQARPTMFTVWMDKRGLVVEQRDAAYVPVGVAGRRS